MAKDQGSKGAISVSDMMPHPASTNSSVKGKDAGFTVIWPYASTK